jgi:tetratricopeptide (TPR) repeat protein
MSAAVSLCLVALVAECLTQYPYYLAYFNQLAGGPRNAYKHLVDSSLDWGQDLCRLKRWLKEHDLDGAGKAPVYLAYFGTARPSYYHIRATELCRTEPRFPAPLSEGVYCISATALQQIYSLCPARWCADYERSYQEGLQCVRLFGAKDPLARSQFTQARYGTPWNVIVRLFYDLRLGRLCAFLRRREPDDNIGYSILVYRLTTEDLQNALSGPPVELDQTPRTTPYSERAREIKICTNRAWALATSPIGSVRNGAEAVELARRANQFCGGRQPLVLDVLAAAYAEAGRFPEALETASKALRLATQQNNRASATALQARITLYKAGKPFHQPLPASSVPPR